MFDHDIRWYVLLPVALIIAFATVFAEAAGLWFDFPSRPDWLWILAFFAILRVPPAQGIAAFFVCGLVRDLFLGPRLGSATAAFVVVGWIALYWRFLATTRGWIFQVVIAGMSAFLVALVKHGLDYGPLTYRLMERWFFVSIADGVLTALAYLPLALILSQGSFRPWRMRSGY